MSTPDRNREIVDLFTEAKWERIADALLRFCREKLLRRIELWLGAENSAEVEDVILKTVEDTLTALRAGKLKSPRTLGSLRSIDLESNPTQLPEWLKAQVITIARKRSGIAYWFAPPGKRATEDEAADVADEHASPDEEALTLEHLSQRRDKLAAAASLLSLKDRRLVSRWIRHLDRQPTKKFRHNLSPLQFDQTVLRVRTALRKAGIKWGREDHAQRAVRPRKRAKPDALHFTITAPVEIPEGSASMVDVWTHLSSQRSEVLKLATRIRGKHTVTSGSKGPVPVARGTRLTVQLFAPGCKVRPVEDAIFWEGEIANASFAVTVPNGRRPGTIGCDAIVRAEGLSIARIAFVLRVAVKRGKIQAMDAEVTRHRRAFASYASEDRDAMLGRIQGMQKVAPELDVFIDVAKLRSGERWRDRLKKEILSRDVLFLFWSVAASKSRWVGWEWRCGFQARGVDFIDPVPLAPPDEVPPPKELAELHFNDWVLAYMRGQPETNDTSSK